MFGINRSSLFSFSEGMKIRDVGFPPKNYGMSRKAKRHDKARLMAKFAKK